jgi:hypothetical protein
MTYNTIGYIAFGIIMYFTIFHLGHTFHKHGRVYMIDLFKKESHLVDSINNLLLLGYYLLNLGYATWSIIGWPQIQSLGGVFELVARQSGIMIIMLGVIHYFNMFGLVLYSHFRNKESIHV